MDLTKREKIGLSIFLTIIILITSYNYYKENKNNEITVIKNSVESNKNESQYLKREIKVYICGEVKKPGVYTLQEGDRLYKLIDMCGGFTENAVKESLNLAMKLKDEDYIFVPSKLNNQINQAGSITKNMNSKININTAEVEELKNLPRIGDALAKRIIEYREKFGPFKDIKDIKNVSGIGDKMFENIKDRITVR